MKTYRFEVGLYPAEGTVKAKNLRDAKKKVRARLRKKSVASQIHPTQFDVDEDWRPGSVW